MRLMTSSLNNGPVQLIKTKINNNKNANDRVAKLNNSDE